MISLFLKKGAANDPSNNRPIALLNPLGKVMERTILSISITIYIPMT